MNQPGMTPNEVRKQIGAGGAFYVQYWHNSNLVTEALYLLGCTYEPEQPCYLICQDRWLSLVGVVRIIPIEHNGVMPDASGAAQENALAVARKAA